MSGSIVGSPSLILSFAAGFISFVSPCVLPLVPGYLAAVSGVSPRERTRRVDRATVLRSLLFIATFSAIFIVLGLTATALGSFLGDNKQALTRVAGAVIVVMGLLFVGSVLFVRLGREWRPTALIERAGRGGPILAGAAFALAWTPCVGPTLGAILGLASQTASVGHGALLLAVYSAGLALPFLFSAVAFDAAQRSFGWFKRHYAAVQLVAGAVLVAMGVLVFTGELFRLNIEAQNALNGAGLNL